MSTKTTSTSSSTSDDDKQKNFFTKYVVEDPNFAKGSYGKVVLARDLKGKQVVIKMIPIKVATKWIYHELEAGSRLDHPNIVKLVDHLSTSNYHYLVFEFFKGLELFELLELQDFKPVDETDVRFIFQQLISALEHAQQQGVCHRDIKLENILVNRQYKLSLLDFGLSSINSPSDYESNKSILSKEFVGSENYTAPEIIKRLPYNPFQVDSWSCGIVLFALLFGQFPWDDLEKELDIVSGNSTSIRQPRIRFPKDAAVSDSAKQLIVQMLHVDPEKRITLKQILNHEWLSTSTSEEESE